MPKPSKLPESNKQRILDLYQQFYPNKLTRISEFGGSEPHIGYALRKIVEAGRRV